MKFAHFQGDVRTLLKKIVPSMPTSINKKVDFEKAHDVIDKALLK